MQKLIVFTDLDGTLLDCATYSFEKALPALALIKKENIPLIICSSKTRAEIEHYRKKLDNHHPFVSENGGGIFIPKNYFDFPLPSDAYTIEEDVDYDIIRLGGRYSDLRNAVIALRQEGFSIKGFGDMSVVEVSDNAGLSIHEAEMAKEREYDEPFLFDGDMKEVEDLLKAIRDKGFNQTEGRFFHILGNSDKGKAVAILIDLYKRRFGDIKTIALGDSPNDIPMLMNTDIRIIVRKPDGLYDARIDLPNLQLADGIGPTGWDMAVTELLKHSCLDRHYRDS